MPEAERFEDMSRRGRLRVIQQDDGDMIVEVIEDLDSRGPCAGLSASVEFCTSGGKSPKTREALRALMIAMAEENEARPHCLRRGERGLGVDQPLPEGEPALEFNTADQLQLTDVERRVLAERRRQIDAEGWTLERDRAVNNGGDLAQAAAFYALYDLGHEAGRVVWPGDPAMCKPKDAWQNRLRAAALMIAALERSARPTTTAGGSL